MPPLPKVTAVERLIVGKASVNWNAVQRGSRGEARALFFGYAVCANLWFFIGCVLTIVTIKTATGGPALYILWAAVSVCGVMTVVRFSQGFGYFRGDRNATKQDNR
jgi:uncharacterized membrane protein